MKIAFWKGTDPGFGGVLDRSIRWWTNGSYSHCELIFSDGWTGSCSWSEGGVVLLQRSASYYDPKNWDIVEIEGDEAAARAWFKKNRGTPYDLLGDFGFVWRPIRGEDGAYFCSEAIALSLGWPNAWRYDPNTQADVLRIPKYRPAAV
ncbi:hypothetical protein [Ralstonia phage RP31]|uniref:Uncharacterized protein n=2 Tax=Ripduovirus RP12 TaxID=2560700 RepID=A0A1L7N100_9CAUD|nr:enoyl-CoA hydratase/carnithine racemase-like [Ralstonia phage RP12]BAW19150.1 hypothetical protein [Ralstonia phage RP12]BAW19436.1 hypothetical protein [Ralstonia phage RP31]